MYSICTHNRDMLEIINVNRWRFVSDWPQVMWDQNPKHQTQKKNKKKTNENIRHLKTYCLFVCLFLVNIVDNL